MGTLGIALQVAPLKLPEIPGLLLYLLIVYAVIVWVLWAFPWFHRIHSRPNARRPMALLLVALICGVIGLIVGPLIWLAMPHEIAQQSPAGPLPVPELAQPDDLEVYFFAFVGAAGQSNIQYNEVTLTNRSSRKMHLELWAHIYYWKDSGEAASLGFQPEWNPDGLKENTGQSSIDLDAFETKKGSLVLFVDKPEKNGLRRWNLDATRNVYIHAFDSVTGKHIAFKAMSGYPADKVSWPLPSPTELLALKFPEVSASNQQSLPASESLEVLLRTRGHKYNSKGVNVLAAITNLSANRMNIRINLLTRKSPDEKEWQTFPGLFVPSQKKDSPDYDALDFGPGDVADCTLVFPNTGFINKEGQELKEGPDFSLVEITDQVSGKKVWCAIDPGYPPGTDMRSATIQPPSKNPQANSTNPPADESKDTK